MPALRAEGITYGYTAQEPILTDWSASFEPGSITAITGRSGRGKSTLLYLLGLMLRPCAGEIYLAGQSLAHLSDAARATRRAFDFGFVFQDASLDPTRSVIDNITEPALYRGHLPRALRQRAGQLMDRFGVQVNPDRRPGQISGGQAQRISLCRALVGNPAIVLADEPTGNLDRQSAAVVVAALQDHAHQGGIVIVVTHSVEVAADCDREIRL